MKRIKKTFGSGSKALPTRIRGGGVKSDDVVLRRTGGQPREQLPIAKGKAPGTRDFFAKPVAYGGHHHG